MLFRSRWARMVFHSFPAKCKTTVWRDKEKKGGRHRGSKRFRTESGVAVPHLVVRNCSGRLSFMYALLQQKCFIARRRRAVWGSTSREDVRAWGPLVGLS